MQRFIVAIILILFFLAPAMAADQLCFSWTPNDPADGGDHYTLYQDVRANKIVDNIAYDQSSVCINKPTDGAAHLYFLTASSADAESANSQTAKWYPIYPDPDPIQQPPVTVGGFKVTVMVEPQ